MNETLVIEGTMKGSIDLEKHQLTVGAKGRVEGEIHAHNVTISIVYFMLSSFHAQRASSPTGQAGCLRLRNLRFFRRLCPFFLFL